MGNLRPFADGMKYWHRSLLKVRCGCFDPARFYNFSASSSCLGHEIVDSFYRLLSEPPSVRSSFLFGGGGRRCFKKADPFCSIQRQFSSASAARSPPPSWLMLPPGWLDDDNSITQEVAEEQNRSDYSFDLYDVLEEKVLKISRNNNLRLPWQREVLPQNEATCVGSSQGWLAFIHPRNCSLYLFNPLLMDSDFPYLPLPPVETLARVASSVSRRKDPRDPSSIVTEYKLDWKYSSISSLEFSHRLIKKIVLSSASLPFVSNDNRNQDITVMVIQGYDDGNGLAFCKLGHTAWTSLYVRDEDYLDIVYFTTDQRFYALNDPGTIEAWDLSDPNSPKFSLIITSLPPMAQPTMDEFQRSLRDHCKWNCRRYLVESHSGDLLMVVRYYSHSVDVDCTIDFEKKVDRSLPNRTVEFDVYKLDFAHKKWVYVPSLGDQALFVGENHCVSLSSSNFPGLSKNSIYFTCLQAWYMGDKYGGHDLGVFDLEDGTVTTFFQCDSNKIQPPPVWVIPPQSCAEP